MCGKIFLDFINKYRYILRYIYKIFTNYIRIPLLRICFSISKKCIKIRAAAFEFMVDRHTDLVLTCHKTKSVCLIVCSVVCSVIFSETTTSVLAVIKRLVRQTGGQSLAIISQLSYTNRHILCYNKLLIKIYINNLFIYSDREHKQ